MFDLSVACDSIIIIVCYYCRYDPYCDAHMPKPWTCMCGTFLELSYSWFYFVGLQLLRRTRLLMGLVGDRYIYWDDLHELSGTSHQGPLVVPGPSSSPINLPHLSSFLSHYPDYRLASYILLGIRDGFRIGLAAPVTIRSSSRNHSSCQSCPGVITDYISAERSAGRMSGPWPASDSLHVSPIGLVPKGHDGVTWRMIVDLSYPRGQSVNDCIPSNLCSLSYPSVDDAVDYVMELGRFMQMVKLDLKSAYRILPIHPCDRSVLGVSWEGQVYLDHCLPFGLCSAPKIFTAFLTF